MKLMLFISDMSGSYRAVYSDGEEVRVLDDGPWSSSHFLTISLSYHQMTYVFV